MREVLGNFQWRVRAFVLLWLDIIAMGVASFLALWVQSEFVFSDIGTDVLRSVYGYMPFNVVITVAIFALFHLYTSLWKYASVNELVNAGLAVLTAGILNWIVMWIAGVGAPNSYPILYITLFQIIYVFLTIFLYLLKCPQSLILSALRAFCFCGKPHISRSIFLYFRYQAWLKSW